MTIEVNWLKKNLELSHSIDLRKQMLERHDGCEISVKRQCELLSISRSTAYYTPKPGCMFEVLIKTRIDRIYTEHPYYGYRRITAVLQKEGYTVNHKRVRRYMREMGIYVIYPGPNLSKRNKAHKVYPYLLRNLPITRANQVWGVDITYVSMPKGWMYLFVIIDWYSRCIIDYELSKNFNFSVDNGVHYKERREIYANRY